MSAFQSKLTSKHLLKALECFLLNKDNKIYFNVVEEYGESNLENEIKNRKLKFSRFPPKHISFLLRCVFKGILILNKNNITHGNLCPSRVIFLDDGFTKLSNWYNFNRDGWVNDFVDACSTIYQSVTLNLITEPFTLKLL